MDLKITSIRKWPATDLKRAGQLDTVIFIEDDDGRADLIILPFDTNDSKKIEEGVRNEFKARGSLIGHKIKVP